MRFFVGTFLLLLALPLWSVTTITTQVSDLDHGLKSQDETLVFLSSGLVAKVALLDGELLERLYSAKENESWLEVTVNEDRQIVAAKLIAAPIEPMPQQSYLKDLPSYTPSIIGTMEEATRIFQDGRKKHKESQCYNRAHIWVYEWRVKHNLFTSKAWLFFTRKYIRKFNFEWWFHVAPLFNVLQDGKVYERVADVKYARAPMKLKAWTDIFLRNNAECTVVSSYSEHANYPESSWCFVMKSPMYYYQPLDLELLEKDGTERQLWNPSEIKQAYKEAFDLDV